MITFLYRDLTFFVGQTVHIGIHPSKVLINKLQLDKDRKGILERKGRARGDKMEVDKIQVEEKPATSEEKPAAATSKMGGVD